MDGVDNLAGGQPPNKARIVFEPLDFSVPGIERLSVTVETDGTLEPRDAVARASAILLERLRAMSIATDESLDHVSLRQPIACLGLDTRATHCLCAENIYHVYELVQHTRMEILKIPNLGLKTLQRIESALQVRGLRLGMRLPGYPIPASLCRRGLPLGELRAASLP